MGNTLARIRVWITGLLLRWPHQVPSETFGLWNGPRVIVGAIVVLAGYVGLTRSWDAFKELVVEATPADNSEKFGLESISEGAHLDLLKKALALR